MTTKPAIGFGHGEHEGRETKWEKAFGAGTLIYTKSRVATDYFIYGIEYQFPNGASKTSWQTPQDLDRDEVENLPRFREFLEGRL